MSALTEGLPEHKPVTLQQESNACAHDMHSPSAPTAHPSSLPLLWARGSQQALLWDNERRTQALLSARGMNKALLLAQSNNRQGGV